MDIEKFINNFIENSKKSFTFSNLKKTLPQKTDTPERFIVDILEENRLLFKRSTKEGVEYLPRHLFFKNVSFFITPTEEEIDLGILIPGHKFTPFYNEDLFPCESFEIIDPENEYICVKHMDFKLEDLYRHYFLLGADNIIDSFTADNPDNRNLFGNPNNKIKISVFDFKDFYHKTSFCDGDKLLFKIIDWTNGTYEVSSIKYNKIDEKDINEFSEHFAGCLHNIFDKHGQWPDIPEQLAYAYLECNKKYLSSPVLSISDFIDTSGSVQVKFIENHTLLWHTEKEEQKPEDTNSFLKISNGAIESLDAILQECTKFLTTTEITAFIIDALQNDSADKEEVLSKFLPDTNLNFMDKAQYTSFNNFYEELFEVLSENFEKEDSKISEIRSKILNELENFYLLYETQIKNLKEKIDLTEIEENIIFIRKILQHLNSENFLQISNEEIEELDNLVFGVLTKFFEEIENLELD